MNEKKVELKSLELAPEEQEHDDEPECRAGVQPKSRAMPSVTLNVSAHAFECEVVGPDVKENAGIVFQLAQAFKNGCEKQEARSEVG